MGTSRQTWRIMVNGVWQKAADRMCESLGQVSYETWITPLNFIDLQGRTAIIEAPNVFFRDWVKDRYLELMQQVLSTEIRGWSNQPNCARRRGQEQKPEQERPSQQ